MLRGGWLFLLRLCSYTAFSYNWADEQLTLKRDAYYHLTRPGNLYSNRKDIPTTIMNAMILCCRMSVRFLWIDAMCILQDYPQDFKDQICNMDAIYIGARFTIVAASGTDSQSGLPGVRRGSWPVQRRRITKDLILVAAQPDLNFALRSTSWHHRAWAF